LLKLMISLLVIPGLIGLIGCGKEPAAAGDPSAKPYPLKTCVVSGEELGKMGEPMRFTYKGQEIKLCCKGCDKDFQKDPGIYLRKIAAATGN